MANRITEFIESLPEGQRQQARDSFLAAFGAMLKAEDIERARGKDPVGWAFKRLDFTGAPFPIYLDHPPFCGSQNVPCRLEWWPNGERWRYVEDGPARVAVYNPISTEPIAMSVSRRRVEPERKRYDFTLRGLLAFEQPDEAADIIAAIVRQHTGFMPRIRSERATYDGSTGGAGEGVG